MTWHQWLSDYETAMAVASIADFSCFSLSGIDEKDIRSTGCRYMKALDKRKLEDTGRCCSQSWRGIHETTATSHAHRDLLVRNILAEFLNAVHKLHLLRSILF